MSDHKNKTEVQTNRQEQKRVDQVATKVKVGDLDRSDLRFFHRDKKYLGEEQLKQILASIHHEGLQVPIEFYRDGDRKVLVKGHLRVAAYHLLARKGTPGFLLENEIDAIEVRTSDTKDLLVRSILDNTVRRSLDQVDRIRAARALYEANVPESRAAVALGVSLQSYRRDLLIAGDRWMFDHVVRDNINPTAAAKILKAIEDAQQTAKRADFRDGIQAELDQWIERKRTAIEQKDRELKLKGKRQGLSAADKVIKRYVTNELADHWVELILQGQPLDDDAEWAFRVDLDPDKDLLEIGGVRLNLAKDPVRKLVDVASKLSQLVTELSPILQKRYSDEQRGVQSPGKAVIRDIDFLRKLGLTAYVEKYEVEQRELAEAGAEDQADPALNHVEARSERDLAEEVEIPIDPSTSTPPGQVHEAQPDEEEGEAAR